MNFSQNNKNSTCIKHLDVKYQFMREKMHEHVTCIEHISMNSMLMDPLTKSLVIRIYHVTNIGLAKVVLGSILFLLRYGNGISQTHT